jgi:hypothetical protein
MRATLIVALLVLGSGAIESADAAPAPRTSSVGADHGARGQGRRHHRKRRHKRRRHRRHRR